jgi:hypothetical protein
MLLVELIGGVFGFLIRKLRGQPEPDPAQQREAKRTTLNDHYHQTLAQCPPLYICETDHLVFAPSLNNAAVPVTRVMVNLEHNGDPARLMKLFTH